MDIWHFKLQVLFLLNYSAPIDRDHLLTAEAYFKASIIFFLNLD